MEEDDGAWVLRSVVDPTRKHSPDVILLLGKLVENNAEYLLMCREMGASINRWRRMSVGGDPPMPAGN